MILLQILAGILLIPLTLAALLLFNCFVRHWIWQLGVAGFGLFYAGIIALTFLNITIGFWGLVIITVIYGLRMHSMAFGLKEKAGEKAYPALRGDIVLHHVKLRTPFAFSLSFLNLARLTPGVLNRKLSRSSGLDINLGELIPQFLRKGRGTEVRVYTEQADIYFEIQ